MNEKEYIERFNCTGNNLFLKLEAGYMGVYYIIVFAYLNSVKSFHIFKLITILCFLFFFFLAALLTCGILVPRPGIEPGPWQ